MPAEVVNPAPTLVAVVPVIDAVPPTHCRSCCQHQGCPNSHSPPLLLVPPFGHFLQRVSAGFDNVPFASPLQGLSLTSSLSFLLACLMLSCSPALFLTFYLTISHSSFASKHHHDPLFSIFPGDGPATSSTSSSSELLDLPEPPSPGAASTRPSVVEAYLRIS